MPACGKALPGESHSLRNTLGLLNSSVSRSSHTQNHLGQLDNNRFLRSRPGGTFFRSDSAQQSRGYDSQAGLRDKWHQAVTTAFPTENYLLTCYQKELCVHFPS